MSGLREATAKLQHAVDHYTLSGPAHLLKCAEAMLSALSSEPAQEMTDAQPASEFELVDSYAKAYSRRDELHTKYMGKVMPDREYELFTKLRDETLPKLRAQIIDALAASTAPASPAPGELGAVESARKNVHGDIARPDLDKHAYEHHWQRPDGTVYAVDSSD